MESCLSLSGGATIIPLRGTEPQIPFLTRLALSSVEFDCDTAGGRAATLAALAASAAGAPLHHGAPVVPASSLPAAETSVVDEMGAVLGADYATRAAVLRQRAECTVAAMLWSRRLKDDDTKRAALGAWATARLDALPEPRARNARDVLAARDELRTVYKASTADSAATAQGARGTRLGAAKAIVLVQAVPDRGGRPGDRRARMPKLKDRVAGGGGAGRGRGRGRGRGKKSKGKGGNDAKKFKANK